MTATSLGGMGIMSVTLRLETDDETQCPYRFVHSDSGRLAEFCTGADEAMVDVGGPLIGYLQQELSLDLRPLALVAEDDLELEHFAVAAECAADAERIWREHLVRNEAAWQPPEGLATCVRAVVRALLASPGLLDHLRPRPGLPAAVVEYYAGGGLGDDLSDLLLMADWTEACGVRWVRLVAQ